MHSSAATGTSTRAPNPGEVVERGDRLLDELEVVAGEQSDDGDGSLDVPRAVGVDAERDARPDRVAHLGDEVHVVAAISPSP